MAEVLKMEAGEERIQATGAAVLEMMEAEERIQRAFETFEGALEVSSQLEAGVLILSRPCLASSVLRPWRMVVCCFSARQWIDSVDVLLAGAAAGLILVVLALLLEVALVLVNVVTIRDLTCVGSCFLRPS
jgi:hypothetical protein